jgi:hypothetical protein
MAADDPELSSFSTTLAELERRLGAAAKRFDDARHDDVVAALYEAERSVRSATRSVDRARRLL